MKYNDNILLRYMSLAPLALAFERYLECQIYSHLQLKRPVLDLGCGDGLFAHILFAEKIDTGIDPNPKELEHARQLGCYEELIACQGHAIPKPDESYATIYANSVLEHIRDIEPVFREVYRLLKPGGVFYITVPSQHFDQYSLISRLLTAVNLSGLAKRYRDFYNRFWKHYHCYPLNKWENIGREVGFEVSEAYTYDPKSICTLNDLLVLFSIPAFLTKQILNRWILFPPLRRFLIRPLVPLALCHLAGGEKAEQGGLVFIAFTKNRERLP